ncbi:PTS system D-fructose-specific IIA component (F1P-forming), Frc family [Natronoarchaeum philippinense]|uniref:PTS system D-fructose-specific IIA component (F1P-forming), Frc family n=1 Tax=Natronoarchaeum philippinense TaxID=558529 RepID=A0A285NSR4_NATPI|nr:fructose PTS transporter subunit IIA [Natronoarchaeum philippinense]SNZ12505.1 PTS system D-fructose-specific IIA component (F1P-forming), Frc family [Natronoarchaeum philippinense]
MSSDAEHTPLTTDLIALEGAPADKRGVIEFLLGLAVDADRVTDREQALDDLLAREEEATTGVGMGIGIPHAKSAAVTAPTIAFTRVPEGIDFDAMDDEPATLIFMLLVPEEGGEEHLQMLSSLSRSLMHEETREELHDAESKDHVESIVLEAVEE